MFVPAAAAPFERGERNLILMSNLTMILNYEQLPFVDRCPLSPGRCRSPQEKPRFPLVVVAAGIGLSIWSLNAPALEDSKNLSASLMLVGGVVALSD